MLCKDSQGSATCGRASCYCWRRNSTHDISFNHKQYFTQIILARTLFTIVYCLDRSRDEQSGDKRCWKPPMERHESGGNVSLILFLSSRFSLSISQHKNMRLAYLPAWDSLISAWDLHLSFIMRLSHLSMRLIFLSAWDFHLYLSMRLAYLWAWDFHLSLNMRLSRIS